MQLLIKPTSWNGHLVALSTSLSDAPVLFKYLVQVLRLDCESGDGIVSLFSGHGWNDIGEHTRKSEESERR